MSDSLDRLEFMQAWSGEKENVALFYGDEISHWPHPIDVALSHFHKYMEIVKDFLERDNSGGYFITHPVPESRADRGESQ